MSPKRLLDIPSFDATKRLTRKQLIRVFDRAFHDLQTCLANNGFEQLSFQLSGPKLVFHDPAQLPHLDGVTVARWHMVNRGIKSGTRYDFRSDGQVTIHYGTLTNELVKPEMELCTCAWEGARRHLLKGLVKSVEVNLLAARSLLTVFTPELAKELDLPRADLWEEKKPRRR